MPIDPAESSPEMKEVYREKQEEMLTTANTFTATPGANKTTPAVATPEAGPARRRVPRALPSAKSISPSGDDSDGEDAHVPAQQKDEEQSP